MKTVRFRTFLLALVIATTAASWGSYELGYRTGYIVGLRSVGSAAGAVLERLRR